MQRPSLHTMFCHPLGDITLERNERLSYAFKLGWYSCLEGEPMRAGRAAVLAVAVILECTVITIAGPAKRHVPNQSRTTNQAIETPEGVTVIPRASAEQDRLGDVNRSPFIHTHRSKLSGRTPKTHGGGTSPIALAGGATPRTAGGGASPPVVFRPASPSAQMQ